MGEGLVRKVPLGLEGMAPRPSWAEERKLHRRWLYDEDRRLQNIAANQRNHRSRQRSCVNKSSRRTRSRRRIP